MPCWSVFHYGCFSFVCLEENLLKSKELRLINLPLKTAVLNIVYFVKHNFNSAVFNKVAFYFDFSLYFLCKNFPLRIRLYFQCLNHIKKEIVSLVEVSYRNQALFCFYMVLVKNTVCLLLDFLVEINAFKNQRQNFVSGFQGAEAEINHFIENFVNQNEVLSNRILGQNSAEILKHVFYSEESAQDHQLAFVGQAGNDQVNRLSFQEVKVDSFRVEKGLSFILFFLSLSVEDFGQIDLNVLSVVLLYQNVSSIRKHKKLVYHYIFCLIKFNLLICLFFLFALEKPLT